MEEIRLPNTIGTRDVGSLFSVAKRILESQASRIDLNCQSVEFVEPFGLCVLVSALRRAGQRKVGMNWLSTDMAGYMNRMKFFDAVDVEGVEIPLRFAKDHADKLVELVEITNPIECDQIAHRLANAITGTMMDPPSRASDSSKNIDQQFWHPIWYSLSELLENSITHARRHGYLRSSVWVASQYYPRSEIVRFSVVDDGCGFLTSLYKVPELKEKSHGAAIRAALLPKISSNRDGSEINGQINQGVGLTTTSKIAKAAQGGLVIVSGDGVHDTLRPFANRALTTGFWQGAAIGFHCRRAKLPQVKVRELFPPDPQSPTVHIRFE